MNDVDSLHLCAAETEGGRLNSEQCTWDLGSPMEMREMPGVFQTDSVQDECLADDTIALLLS